METEERSIVDELIDEVKSYLPAMKEFLHTLDLDSTDQHASEELHRMSHTIGGAASMVGMTELSRSAQILEHLAGDVLAGKRAWNPELVDTVNLIVDAFAEYFASLPDDGTRGSALLAKTRELTQRFQADTGAENESAPEDDLSLEEMLFAGSDDETDHNEDFLEGVFGDQEDTDDLPGLDSLFAEQEDINVEEVPAAAQDTAADVQSLSLSSVDVVSPQEAPESTDASAESAAPQLSPFELEMQESFQEEAAEHLSTLHAELNTLEGEITEPSAITDMLRKRLHVIRRSVHTLKGAAAVVGIKPVAAWGHSFEDFLDWLHDDAHGVSPEIIGAMIDGTELLATLAEDSSFDAAPVAEKLQAGFKKIMDEDDPEFAAAKASPPPADVVSPQEAPEGTDTPAESAAPQLSPFELEMQESFQEEAAEHLSTLHAELNTLEGEITEPSAITDMLRKRLHVIRRSVHTLKGAAAVVGIKPVAAWGHSFEDFLDWLHDDAHGVSPEIIAAMIDGTELLATLTEDSSFDAAPVAEKLQVGFKKIMDADAPVSKADKSVTVGEETRGSESAIDAGLEQSFDIESEEYLEGMGRQLNLLTSIILEPTVIDKALYRKLDTIRKAAHGLRGASGVVGHAAMMRWAEEVELFLDWLLSSAELLTTEIVTALVDATIILEKYCGRPNSAQEAGQEKIRKIFSAIQQHIDSDSDAVQPASAAPVSRPSTMPARKFVRSNRQKPAESAKKKTTIRVRGDKLERISGLGGDFSINLGSFEDADSSMQVVFDDFAMIWQRLKGISSSLEAGYELATIPHFGGMGGSGQADGVLDEFDPLEMDRYSELNILIRSMQEAVQDMESIMDQGGKIRQTWRQAVDRQSKLVTEVQTAVQSIQMTPFSTLANRLYRTVRESSRATGKRVRLAIDGGSIEMDTHVWDVLADPLMHMLRNAVDHGVEDKDTRRNAGKAEQAEIRITCSRKGSRFVLRLADDGSGLDYEAIRAKAQKLYPDMDTASMDQEQLGGLIFRQGFSVRTKVSDISGRGVGMDVVRDAVEQLNGSVEVQSIQGRGVEFILSIPIIVAMLPALMVSFAEQVFALPMRDVGRIIRIPEDQSSERELVVDAEKFPVYRPAEMFHLTGRRQERTSYPAGAGLGIIVDAGGERGVLIADKVLGQKEIVFKNLSWPLDGIPFVTGSTIMGDGSLVPILNVEDILAVDLEKSVPAAAVVEKKEKDALTILFADDSISIRKVLEKFISYYGWNPVAAHDGVDALEKVRVNRADLIILDIEMPKMNGFEVLRALKAQDEYRDIPVLMLTSRTAGKYREKAASLGARGFVTKPFNDRDLRELIRSLTKQ